MVHQLDVEDESRVRLASGLGDQAAGRDVHAGTLGRGLQGEEPPRGEKGVALLPNQPTDRKAFLTDTEPFFLQLRIVWLSQLQTNSGANNRKPACTG